MNNALFILAFAILSTMWFVPYLTQDAFAASDSYYNASWDYRKTITIDNTKVSGSGTHTDFPILVSITDTNLKDNAQSDGDDILFTSSDGHTKLSHEIESYNSSTGALVAWVKVPTLSTSADTVLYMYYGNSGASNQQDVVNTWNSNYKGVWHLSEDPSGSAPQALDSTTNDNDATSNGGMTTSDQVTGKMGGAVDFDGTSDYLQAAHSSSLNIVGNKITLSAWAKMTSGQSNDHGLVLKSTSSGYEYQLGIQSEETPNFRVNTSTGGTYLTGSTTLSVGTWYFIYGIYDGSTVKVYVNGVEYGSGSRTGNIDATTEPLRIGKRGGSDNRFFLGNIDEVHVSDVARSTDWMVTEYNNQNAPATFISTGTAENGVPGIPTGLTATSGDTQVSLSWTAPSNVGNAAITDYKIEYSSDGGTSWTIFSHSSTSTSATVTSLTNDQSYQFRVSAINSVGTGSASTVATAMPVSAELKWYNSAWSFRKTITIDNTKVSGSGSHTDFSVLVSITDTNLKDNAQSDGDDILFTLSNGHTKLSHEIESYNSSTGALVAWVKVPTLSTSADTVLYMYYGNSGATNQQDVTNVWDSNYKAVWHLDEDPSGSAPQMSDSTSNARHGTTVTMTSGDQVAGQVDGSLDFDGTSDRVDTQNFMSSGVTQMTAQAWINMDFSKDSRIVYKNTAGNAGNPDFGLAAGGSTIRARITTDVTSIDVSSGSIPMNTWTFAAFTYDGSNLRLYKNGALQSTNAITGTIAADSNVIVIGQNENGASLNRYFPGTIDEVRLSTIARSTDWLLTEYNNQNAPSTFISTGSVETDLPGTPTNLAATLDDTQVSLSWTAPSASGAAITDYKIEYSSDGGTSWTIFSHSSTSTSATVTSLTNDQSYQFRVSAINSVGTGSASSTATATPNWAAPVASNMIVIPGNGTATIKWDVSVSADPITSVTVQTNSTNNASSFTNIASGNVAFTDSTDGTRTLVVSGLTNDQTYILKIIPVNTGGSGSATNIVVVMPTANPNTSFNFVQPPDAPSSGDSNAMIALGLPSDFVMPSAGYVPSSSFNPFDESLNQKLRYTTAIATSVSLETILDDYKVQQYTKPSDWTVNDVWTVPPAIIPLAGNIGEAAAYSMDTVDSMKPVFTAFNGATELSNGGKLGGVKYALQSTASNLNMTQKFLSEAPSGVTTFESAKMYMSFDLETSTGGIDFGSAAAFSTPPVVSFTMGPDPGSITSPTSNTVNAAITCPVVTVNFISGSTSSSAGITVTRDTNGDTSTACGYSATLQHFSNYYADTTRPDGSSDIPGGSCNDCTPPTLGMTKGGLIRVVDNGFSYNNNPIDVEYFYTPYPLLTVEIGQENVVELKIYENSGASYLKHVGMSFGLGPQQLFGVGIVLIEWDRLFDGTEKVSVTDPNNLLEDDVRVDVSPDLVKCTASSITEQCTVIRIYHTFREAPEFQMLSTYVWDVKRNGWQNYYNHGIEVVGESLNPPDEYDGVNKGHIYHLMETGKGMAVDEFGDSWSFHHGIWNKDYVKSPFLRSSITNVEKLQALESLGVPEGNAVFGYDRNQPEFAVYKIGQTLYAKQVMDELCTECSDEPFDKINNIVLTTGKKPTLRSDDPVLQEAISQESTRAAAELGAMFEQMYGYSHGKDLSYLNIDADVKDLQYLSNIEFEDVDLSFGIVTQSTLVEIIAENESDLTEVIIDADEIVTQSTLQIIEENEIDLTELKVWTGRTSITMNVEDKKTPYCLYYNSNFEECIRGMEEGILDSTGANSGLALFEGDTIPAELSIMGLIK